MLIRPYTPWCLECADDKMACMAIAEQCWDRQAAERLGKQIGDGYYYVAEIDERIVGFSGVRASHIMRGAWEVPWIAVAPGHQGSGVGSAVLEAALNLAGKKLASLISLITQKPRFFEKFGFRTVQFYNDGWQLMTVQLTALGMGSFV